MSVLFRPDKTFHSFGCEANYYYRNNSGGIDFKDWYFFEQVQIKLDTHKDKLTHETIIGDSRKNGSYMKALDVFASIIHYLKYRLLNVLNKGKNDEQQRYTNFDIHWVLTLPDISDLNTKIVMKDAATKKDAPGTTYKIGEWCTYFAGISDDQLTFALKPDAVSLYCLEYLLSSETTQTDRKCFTALPQGFQFILYDQGEDTTDITVLEVTGKKELRKIYQAREGHLGGNLVNSEFLQFLSTLFSGPVVHEIFTKYPSDYSQILTTFENIHIPLGARDSTMLIIRIPDVWLQVFETLTGGTLQEVVPCTSYRGSIVINRDSLCITYRIYCRFFNNLTDSVVKVINGLVKNVKIPSVANINTLIAVGNFSKSNIIARSIRKKFPNVAVIVPRNAEIVVLKGAILCGFQPHSTVEKVESESLLSRLPKMNMSDFKNLMSKGDYASYENRVFLAGACNVGKSCLASILIGEEIPKKWYSTDGLTIYFGRNGIHLRDRKMIPLNKSGTSIVNKLLSGTPEMKYDDKQVFEIFDTTPDNVSTLTTENEADDTDLSEDKDLNVHDQSILKDQIQTMEEQRISFDKTKNDKTELPPFTPNILQQTAASVQRDILQEIREGKYKVEIAPSDLVDFGGQRSYDMTHQLFVQHKGTFIIMFDGRFGLHKPLKEYPQQETAEDILVHWVNSILLYCKDDDDIMPMILFAATHSDLLKTDILAETRIKLTKELVQLFSTHVKSRHIMYNRLFFINATNPDDPEIELLKDTLVDIAFSQTNWGQRMPLAWVPIEIQISEMRLKDVSVITKESIQELNKLNKDFTLSEYSLQEFLKFQHSLGKILYFDTEGLDDFIVVQPTAMVNILRSIITDKLFWPEQKDLRWILENISSTGKVQKEHLFKLWSQPQFEDILPTKQHKEYIAQVLVHLDILVEPKHNDRCITNDHTFLVPCVVQSKLPTELLPVDEQKTICLAYHLRESIMPSALTFKLIATPVTIWPLREISGRLCLYFQSVILNVDDSNQLLILIKGQRVQVYLSNNVSRHLISPDVAASIQECLTVALQKVLHFYHDCFGKRLFQANVSSFFDTEVGMLCNKENCLVPLNVAKEKKTWACKKGAVHESKCCLYWVFDKEKKTCNPECKGLQLEVLSLHPNDKHIVRLVEQIGISIFDQFIIYLGLTREEWENVEYQYGHTGKLGVQLMALNECEKKKQKLLQTMSLGDLLDALKEIDRPHSLCQIVREETNLIGIADSALQETPSDDMMKRLPRQLGNCVIQLGIELGLSFASIEETMYNYPKDMYSQLYDILKKWKQSSKQKPSVYILMKALQRTDSGGLTFLRNEFKPA